MQKAYRRFNKLISDTESVAVMYDYFENNVIAPVDTSDLLRWQWVQYISAFDKYIHDIVRAGMMEIFLGNRVPTEKYKNFPIEMNMYVDMSEDIVNAGRIFEQKIVRKHGYQAFQDPARVADALAYIWNESDKWAKISEKMSMEKGQCITFLKNIVIRRNQIVHEGDYIDDISKRQEIIAQDVVQIRDYIKKLGTAIYECVS